MKTNKKKVIIFFAAVAVAVLFLYWFRFRKVPAPTPAPLSLSEQKGFERELEKRGAEGLRKKQYAPLIYSLERLVKEYPEQVELKKKLAEAYRSAGEEEKAETLLKEIQ